MFFVSVDEFLCPKVIFHEHRDNTAFGASLMVVELIPLRSRGGDWISRVWRCLSTCGWIASLTVTYLDPILLMQTPLVGGETDYKTRALYMNPLHDLKTKLRRHDIMFFFIFVLRLGSGEALAWVTWCFIKPMVLFRAHGFRICGSDISLMRLGFD